MNAQGITFSSLGSWPDDLALETPICSFGFTVFADGMAVAWVNAFAPTGIVSSWRVQALDESWRAIEVSHVGGDKALIENLIIEQIIEIREFEDQTKHCWHGRPGTEILEGIVA